MTTSNLNPHPVKLTGGTYNGVKLPRVGSKTRKTLMALCSASGCTAERCHKIWGYGHGSGLGAFAVHWAGKLGLTFGKVVDTKSRVAHYIRADVPTDE